MRSGFVYEGLDKVGLGCRGRHCAGYAVPPPAPGRHLANEVDQARFGILSLRRSGQQWYFY